MGPGRNTSQHAPQCLKLSSEKKNKKSSLLFHRHRHFGMDLSCCCWRVLLRKNFVCFKPRLHPRLAAGATLMLVLINWGVGLRCLTASASLVHPWHMRLRWIRIVNSHLSLNLVLPFVNLQEMWLCTHICIHFLERLRGCTAKWLHETVKSKFPFTVSCSFIVKCKANKSLKLHCHDVSLADYLAKESPSMVMM